MVTTTKKGRQKRKVDFWRYSAYELIDMLKWEGWSFNDIEKATGIHKSTVCRIHMSECDTRANEDHFRLLVMLVEREIGLR